jgi:hypothetical protein
MKTTITILKKCVATLLLAVLLINVLSSFTQTTFAAVSPPSGHRVEVPRGANQSLNWSGYVAGAASNTDEYTSVTGTWTVPKVEATTANSADATWVGIGGVQTRDLIQAGTLATVRNGTVTYSAWIETLPEASERVPLSVHSGDSITTTLTEQSPDLWLITIKNNTSGKEYRTLVEYESSYSTAEWVQEMVSTVGGEFIPLDSFGSVAFTDVSATVDGENKNLQELNAKPLHMVTSEGQTLASTSAVVVDNASFTVSRTDVPVVAVAEQAVPVTLIIVRYKGHNYIFTAPYTFTAKY